MENVRYYLFCHRTGDTIRLPLLCNFFLNKENSFPRFANFFFLFTINIYTFFNDLCA